jgi:carbon monoxide dehydrogenase subunit G
MKLEHSFEVAAPVETVWKTLIDLEQVAPCLPGAAITGHDDDGTYHGTFQVKLGPTTASYRGTIRIQEMDEAAHTATLAAKGTDKRGQGGATATIVNTVRPSDSGGTHVDAVTDFTITGRLASFGRGGMIKDISNKLLGQFSDCLQQRLSGEPEPATAAAGGMTAADAAASAAAEARPEESVTGAVMGQGTGPGDGTATGTVGTATGSARLGANAGAGAPPASSSGQPGQAAPLDAGSLVLGVVRDRAAALGSAIVRQVKALAPVVVQRIKTLLGRARARRSG